MESGEERNGSERSLHSKEYCAHFGTLHISPRTFISGIYPASRNSLDGVERSYSNLQISQNDSLVK